LLSATVKIQHLASSKSFAKKLHFEPSRLRHQGKKDLKANAISFSNQFR
jgi:hypothetical protein